MGHLTVSDVSFSSSNAADVRSGLLGFIGLVLNEALVLDGLTLRKTRSGRLALSYPQRMDRRGDSHPIVRPRNDAARREIESLVFKALGIREDQA